MAAAAAAAAARRIFISPAGGLRPRLPQRTEDKMVVAAAALRGISSIISPAGGLCPRLPQRTGDKTRVLPFVGKRTLFSEAEKDAIKKVVSDSAELIKLRTQVKFYTNTTWVLTGLFGGTLLSLHYLPQELAELKMEIKDLKTKASEGKVHHIYFTPTTEDRQPPLTPTATTTTVAP